MALRVALLAALACLGVLGAACSSPPTLTSACEYLTPVRAREALGLPTTPMTFHLGTTCGYGYGSEDTRLIVQLQSAAGSSQRVPYIGQPGSELITVNGVSASWRPAASPTRTALLDFRWRGAIVEVAFQPKPTRSRRQSK